MLYLTTTLYSAHCNAPWFHSWYSPPNRTRIKNIVDTVQIIMSEVLKIITIGRISAISTSKIKKITAIRKNRIENGIRADLFGSNPHSNGDLFSRSLINFFDSVVARIITIIGIINLMKTLVDRIRIVFLDLYQAFCLEVKCTIYTRKTIIYLINK
ncbi:uncharacterized protein LOC126302173 [Schistocerca gregaria]|uniref:uncharacterized protein LOC126302173 n=1 Tax=Schistocerca gregaria TaxID=7010 RepID=UPI00211ED403|nr:uncharacterized protein LOC126302173 [Schistocerca gregaria]